LQYDPGLKWLARELRGRATLTEVLLWRQLRRRQRQGFDFHRQKPIDRYIVDFFSHELMLAVEIDGFSHKLKGPEDDERQRALEALGIRFLRFPDKLVKTDLDAVVLAIDNWIEANRPKPPNDTPRPSATPLDRGDSRIDHS
jgi:very-short-patch-repair endonuclease